MNMDPLVKRLNQKYGDRANFFYSTPNNYLKAVHATNTTWPLKTDDFFPYADQPHTYWTGYFSSRPTFKKNVREMGNQYRASESFLAHLVLSKKI
jgi:hypothetical protein